MSSLGVVTAVLFATVSTLVFIGIILVLALIAYIINALALHKISKKAGRTLGWLAWIPFAPLQMFVLSDVAHDTPFSLFGGKISFRKRSGSFIAFIVITVIYSAFSGIVSAISSTLQVLAETMPEDALISLAVALIVLSVVSCIVSLVYVFFTICFYYVYTRDIIELFYPHRDSNKRTAILVSIFSSFCPLVLSFYLLSLSKKELPYQFL